MDYLTRKNDRRRRRRARLLTFLVTAAMLAAGAYALGVGEELPLLFQQLLGEAPAGGSVA